MNYNLFKSKTFWTLVVMFLVNGFAAISGQLSPDWVVVINAVLTGVASIFHLQTGNSVSGTN